MNYSPILSRHFPNSCFSPLNFGAIQKDSPLTARKRPNTAPEIVSSKLPVFSSRESFRDNKLSDSFDDDESHFLNRPVSPICTEFFLPSGFRNRINSLSSQDSGIFSDSTSVLSPECSQLDRANCISPIDPNLIFSQALDLRVDSQYARQASVPEFNAMFPAPPRRSKLLSPSRCTTTHPYRLPPSKSACSLSRTHFFSPSKSTPFKRPLTPLPRISPNEQNVFAFPPLARRPVFNSEDPLFTKSLPPLTNSPLPNHHTLDATDRDEMTPITQPLTPSPLRTGATFLPLSQASTTYYSLEDIPAVSEEESIVSAVSTPQLTFSDATRITSLISTTTSNSNNSVVPRSCLSISSGSRSSSEESLPFHTPDKGDNSKHIDRVTNAKLDTLTSKFFCHETFSSYNVVLPPIADTKKQDKYIGKYRIIEQIGSGTYGHVQKGWDNDAQIFVAIKTFVNREPYRGIPQHTYREIRAFQYKSHPGLLESIEVIQTENGPLGFPVLHLVTEFIDQDLKRFIAQFPHLLVEDKIKSIMAQLVSAVSHLNWVLRIMHRDLKPANILISEEGVIKIADFGMAKHYKYMKLLTPQVVTLWYRSPEILMNCAYDYAVDVWSLGCVFAELYNKMPLFEGNSEISQLMLIISRLGSPPKSKWPAESIIEYDQFLDITPIPIRQVIPTAPQPALEAIEAMLEFDPEVRIRSDQIETLEFFK